VDDETDPKIVSYEVVSGDQPTVVVHKTGGGPDQLFEQPGGHTGTVIAGNGKFVGDARSPDDPCPERTVALKFEADSGEIVEGAQKSFPTDSSETGNSGLEIPVPPFMWTGGAIGLAAVLIYRRS